MLSGAAPSRPRDRTSSGCGDELDAVAERVVDVAPPHPGQLVVGPDRVARRRLRRSARASSSRTTSAGWALRAGRKSSSTPRWSVTAPFENQHPPRAASGGGLGDAVEPEDAFVEGLGPVLAPGGMASWTWSIAISRYPWATSAGPGPAPRQGRARLPGGRRRRPLTCAHDMGSLIKKRRKRMRKKKHKKMLKATRWQRRAAGK